MKRTRDILRPKRAKRGMACMTYAEIARLKKLAHALPKAKGKRKASIIAKVRRLVKNKRSVCML